MEPDFFFLLLKPSATKKYGKYIGTCVKVLDMTGLRLSALNHIKVSLSWAPILVCDEFMWSYDIICFWISFRFLLFFFSPFKPKNSKNNRSIDTIFQLFFQGPIWFDTFFLLMQLLTVISTIDDLNYPEKTDTYYIVNAPYIFSACWKVCLPEKLTLWNKHIGTRKSWWWVVCHPWDRSINVYILYRW